MRVASSTVASATAIALFLAAGIGHRVLAGRIDVVLQKSLPLAQPLATIPQRLGDWAGTDIAVDERVLNIDSFDDDYINRVYVNSQLGVSMGLFVGYTGRPREILAHRPDVCFVAHGWDQVSSEHITITTTNGRTVPSILFEFHQPDNSGSSMLVLATHFINGQYFPDAAVDDRYNTRSPGLLGERPGYLTRIQVSLHSSGDRAADLTALREFMKLVAQHTARIMPYWDE